MEAQTSVDRHLGEMHLQYEGAQLLRAREQDVDFAEAITAENMVEFYARRGGAWDARRYKDTFADFENFILWVGDAPAGIIRLQRTAEGLWIRGLEVTQAYWNRGLGSACVKAAFALAQNAGIETVFVKVFAENRAIHMYEVLGFERTDTDGNLTWLQRAV